MKNLGRCLLVLAVVLAISTPVLAHGPSYRAKVYTTTGHIWTLSQLQSRSGYGEWRYWAAGESGVLLWDAVRSITFLENIHPNTYTRSNREISSGQRCMVLFQNGEKRELYVQADIISGLDNWGVRHSLSNHLARIEFLETDHPTVMRCPNGHVWGAHAGYRYCPYDTQPLTPYSEY